MQERIEVSEWLLDDLKPDPDNPRRNEAAVDPVAESIRAFGFRVPVVIDPEGNIVAGHTRYLAAKKLGMEKIPCVVADKLTPKQLKAFQLADNKTGEFASWDVGLLTTELDNLSGIMDMEIFGFNLKPAKSKSEKKTKDPQFVTCPRCGARIPRKQAINYTVEDFEEAEEFADEEEGDGLE